MIDIHNHIVPHVDDGCQSLEESLRLLKQAEKEGVTEIITTPHFIKNGEFRWKSDKITQCFQELKTAYQGTIQLHLGNELYIHPDLPDLLEKKEVLTMTGSQFILVEFPMNEYREEYDEILYELSLKYQVIIAHPERYSVVQNNPNFCLKWLNEGYLLQANQDSLFRKETKRVLIPMIQHGFISFIASDAHNRHRPLSLKEAYLFIQNEVGENVAQLLMKDNPLSILGNKRIINTEYQPIKRKFFLWSRSR